jgi:hypothetical protein
MDASCGQTDQYSEQMLVEVHKSQIIATANSVSRIRSSFGSAKMSRIYVGLTPLNNISNYLATKLAWKPKSKPRGLYTSIDARSRHKQAQAGR